MLAFVIVLFFMSLDKKEKSVSSSTLSKYSAVIGIVFIIIGLIIWIPILNGSEGVFGYNVSEQQENLVVVMNAAYLNPRFFLYAILGLSILVIGILIVASDLFRRVEKLGIKRWKKNSK